MKFKTVFTEAAWIIGAYLINFIAVIFFIKPIHVFLPTLNLSFNETGIQIEGQGAFIPTFLVLLALVYFIKEAIQGFKRQLQNYISMVSSFLAILVLFALNYMFNAISMLITGMQQMSKSLAGLAQNLPNEAGDLIQKNIPTSAPPIANMAVVAQKMPLIIIVTQIVLIGMLTIVAICVGRKLNKSPMLDHPFRANV
ncbi:hypothetical protein FO440_01900 [Mucilaginibacter corticis]|uniref:Uncharacterized protein n=1 Tax=Mucilaginibacter corticis TaxID=2597670 RepID=A0A556MT42_9SPHI|nr:hypothetical protein [Mucilaginibacter corticis]TSJ42969.1 hypothetical protein FO440_01900 [Mucilaginibacter corticis]